MRRTPMALGLVLLTACPVLADCKDEVAAAFAKQRNSGAFRMDVSMINERGPISMSVEYQLPGRMHQVVKELVNPQPSETLLVDGNAWTNSGQGWTSLKNEEAEALAQQVKETVVDPPKELTGYTCLGKVALDGKEYFAYRGEEPRGAAATGLPDSVVPLRQVYVDPETGLPALTTAAIKERADKPFFKARYTYPTDIKIDPPPSTGK